MLKETALYYFSPTGGTRKTGEIFCEAFAKEVQAFDLAAKDIETGAPSCDVVVMAVPVFGGRIPALAVEKLSALEGKGKKAVTLVVYGTRAYEDALLELNHVTENCGFEVIASAALIAQHSIVPAVGQGRPDEADKEDIQNFARKVLEKMDKEPANKVEVPGNYPYKESMKVTATPICKEECNHCGVCEACCPTGAIYMAEEGVTTELDKCILCMACVSHCPTQNRILPPPMQNAMNEKLGAFKDVRRENAYFLAKA